MASGVRKCGPWLWNANAVSPRHALFQLVALASAAPRGAHRRRQGRLVFSTNNQHTRRSAQTTVSLPAVRLPERCDSAMWCTEARGRGARTVQQLRAG